MLSNPEVAAGGVSAASPEVSTLTVLYDGDCSVCGETVRQLRRWDHERRFEFLPFGSASSSGRPVIERLVEGGGLDDGLALAVFSRYEFVPAVFRPRFETTSARMPKLWLLEADRG